jgi:hypothetical protein
VRTGSAAGPERRTRAARGEPAGIGIAHARRLGGDGERDATAVVGPVASPAAAVDARCGPVAETASPDGSSSTETVPSSSVRRTRAPESRSLASVDGAGWPYVLPAPADATATRGRTASTNAWVVAVRLP